MKPFRTVEANLIYDGEIGRRHALKENKLMNLVENP